MAGQNLGERVLDLLLVEGDREREVVAVARHRRQIDSRFEQALRQLPRPIGTEVEEDRGVFGTEARTPLEHDRLDELVGHSLLVALANRRDGIHGMRALAGHDRSDCAVGPLPAVVAIHRVVAPADRCDARSGQLRQILCRRTR